MTTATQIKTKWDEPNILPVRGWLVAETLGTDLETLTYCPNVNGKLAVGFYIDYPKQKMENGATILAKAYLRLKGLGWNGNMDDHTYCHTAEEAKAWILARVNKELAAHPATANNTLEG